MNISNDNATVIENQHEQPIIKFKFDEILTNNNNNNNNSDNNNSDNNNSDNDNKKRNVDSNLNVKRFYTIHDFKTKKEYNSHIETFLINNLFDPLTEEEKEENKKIKKTYYDSDNYRYWEVKLFVSPRNNNVYFFKVSKDEFKFKKTQPTYYRGFAEYVYKTLTPEQKEKEDEKLKEFNKMKKELQEKELKEIPIDVFLTISGFNNGLKVMDSNNHVVKKAYKATDIHQTIGWILNIKDFRKIHYNKNLSVKEWLSKYYENVSEKLNKQEIEKLVENKYNEYLKLMQIGKAWDYPSK